MKSLTRRDLLKGGVAAPAATAVGVPAIGLLAQSGRAQNQVAQTPLRERLLLDFGWRFHFGHANDENKDFGFGAGRSGGFQKSGGFLSPSNLPYDDSDWKPVDLPHDWAIELPFTNDPMLASKGSYPLGRDYPETSVGWYRRVFELPASDAGRRISVEFDGAYRETMVVLNGYYIGRHSGGYDPFRFDLTDFALPGRPNVLLVRVDATLSDGWFYEGAGIYRHVWLTKTAPVHVKQWGTLVTAKVQPGQAALTIRTEVENRGKSASDVRVVSTILDPNGREAGKATSGTEAVAVLDERAFEQQVRVERPALWSLEQRSLYRLVTEVESGGTIVDRYETRFGIRDLKFDPEQGFFLNGKPVKIKGTCNHQDHAGIGVALPDAVQYFRVRKLQEMGCNAMRTSHNPPTPELLDACDELGMLVLDETRMLSSNPDGLSQFENVVRRDRNHPSVQSTKSPGAVKVEVSSPGLTGAAVTITSRAVKLQPQVAVWEREVPSGTGVTGLWRPVRSVAAAQGGNPMALAGGEVDAVYTFRQDGSALTGLVESAGGGGFGPGGGGAAGGPIEDGKIDGSSISFRTGNTTYTGTIEGDQIALRRSGGAGGRGGGRGPAAVESGPRPAIGPPPDGTDPSFGGGGRGGQAPAPIVLKRAKR